MNRNIPTVGYRVETAEGESLGAVAEVWGDFFKVHQQDGEEYWLPVWDVADCGSYMVRVLFTHRFLDEHKIDASVL